MLHEIFHSIVHALQDSIMIFPLLLISYLIIEFIENKTSKKFEKARLLNGKFSPLVASVMGSVPQCGFSVVATNLYVTRIVSLGTLISIYLSTSDEMLVILLSKNAPLSTILPILGVKFIVGMVTGFIIDFILRNKN